MDHQRRLWICLGTGLAATLLWQFPIILPLKLLVVLVHETWHGFAALSSGALLSQMDITLDEWGETMVTGLTSTTGFVWTVSAGYLGSALTGAVLLNRGLAGRNVRLTLIAFSMLLGYMTYLFTAPGSTAFFTGLGWAAVLLLVCGGGEMIGEVCLVALGTLFAWYCVFDLFDFTRDVLQTDAGILARYIVASEWPVLGAWPVGTLAVLASIFWVAVMLTVLGLSVRHAMLDRLPGPPVAAEPEPEPTFPGEVTPEVQDWLLKNGFGLDGRPLPLELVDSPYARLTPGEVGPHEDS
ncbi:MAG: M50 family metallopeptidase [Spirochaetales bacterium]|nr:M50 family metallopeptidase [Leptospiraceae bacterium]MCP5482189.1 M50 family metallopeptidase [Spirochaetales bacterium]MCP5484699.1 M50 family metallopeptidase [Spirochaetales bacterium]